MSKRAERRASRKRLIDRYTRHWTTKSRAEFKAVNHDSWLYKAARAYASTGCLCSCRLCRSPRRLYGNGKAARTFAEQLSILDLQEYV